MNRAPAVLPFPQQPDRLEAARNLVLRADRMSLIDAVQRKAILTLAWSILREDRDQRRAARPAPQPIDSANIITLARARQQRRAEKAAALGLPVTPRRPRIVVRPANPSTPGDAA